MSTLTHLTKSQVPLADYIESKKEKERRLSMEVPHKERLAARDSIVHCRNVKKQPLNVLISFEFEQDQSNLSKDIDRIRRASHYLRMLFQRDGNRESLMVWVRKTAPNSGIEQCYILTHCEDKKLVAFTKQVCSWTIEKFTVEPVDPENVGRLVNGRYISLFDQIFAQTDHLTRHWVKGVYSEAGGQLRGPRVFHSEKLAKSKLIEHRRATAAASKLAALTYNGSV